MSQAKGTWIYLGLLLGALGAPTSAWECAGEGLAVVSAYPGAARVGDNYCAVAVANGTNGKTDVRGTLTVRDAQGNTKATRTTSDAAVEDGDCASLYFGSVTLEEGDTVTIEASCASGCGAVSATSTAQTTAEGEAIDAGSVASSRHTNYQIPANVSDRPLAFNGQTGAPLRLVFGGPKSLKIARVTTTSGVDIVFASASPQDATAFFRDNPLPADAGQVMIRVTNPDGQAHVLAVTAR